MQLHAVAPISRVSQRSESWCDKPWSLVKRNWELRASWRGPAAIYHTDHTRVDQTFHGSIRRPLGSERGWGWVQANFCPSYFLFQEGH
jgi:hypothetical protein